jgi:hypothetical protein
MYYMDYKRLELTGLQLQKPSSNIFETGHLPLEPRYGRLTSAVLGRVGSRVRTNQRYFIISKY